MKQLLRIRWGVRVVLILGIAVSVVANVLHAKDNPISQAIAAWPPLALILTIELISRVPVHSNRLAWMRRIATAGIAGIAAWVSYWHMAGVAARYGETNSAAHLIPLSVDGLVVVASICLVELGGQIGAWRDVSAPAGETQQAPAPALQPLTMPVFLPPSAVSEPPAGDELDESSQDDEDADQRPVQDARTKQEVEVVVRSIKSAHPEWSNQQIADAAVTNKSRVWRILRDAQPINGHRFVDEEVSA